MAARNYTTGLIITGDASGAVRATALTEQALSNLNSSSRRSAQQSSSAWDQLKASMSGLTGAAALAGAGMVVGFGAMVKSAIDAADNLRDLSKSTSISVENLAGLQMAAKQSGTELEAVATAINKLSVNIAKDGDKFKQLGIDAKDPLEAFAQLADVFVSIDDPQQRAAVGAAALGKAWADTAPLLSEGGDAIRAMVAEGRAASGMTTELADNADALNDNIELFKTRVSGAAAMLAGAFLPELNEMITQIQKATAAGVSFNSVMSGVGNWVAGRDGLTEMGQLTKQIVEQKKKISVMKTEGGGFYMIDHLLGYSVVEETKKLDAMLQQRESMVSDYQAKATATAALSGEAQKKISADTLASFVKGSDSHEKAAHKAHAAASKHVAAAKTHVDAIGNELKALDDQHKRLTLSERDYYASTLSAKGASAAQAAMAMAVWDANKALEAQKESGDQAKAALDEQIDRYNKLTLSARDYYSLQLTSKGVAPDKQGPALAQFDKNTGIEAQQQAFEQSRSALAQYTDAINATEDSMNGLAATTTSVFDGALGGINTLTGAMDSMVTSIQKNAQAFEELAKQKQAIDNFKPDRTKDTFMVDMKLQNDARKKYETDFSALQVKNMNDGIDGVRQLASATSQMFDQNSNEAKAFNLVAIAGLAAKAATAMLTQGEGDPYTAFARIAAMGALVSSIVAAGGGGGFSFGGSSGPTMSEAQTAAMNGTGTILGDKSLVSESIDKTYELLKTIHAEEYAELRGINRGIQTLQGGITDTITKIFQGGGLQSVMPTGVGGLSGLGSAIQTGSGIGKLDPISNKLLGGIFGVTKYANIGTGISTGAQSAGAILDGGDVNAKQFDVIQKSTKSWFKKSFSYQVQFSDLDENVNKSLNSVFSSIGEVMLGLSQELGGDLEGQLRAYIIPALSIDLKGLNGEDAAKKLNGILSATMDTMATSVFGGIIGQYQQLGEGMLETAVRIVAEVAVVKDALATSGLSLADNAISISDALVQAAGGLEEFQKQFTAYYDKFYSDTEKQTRLQATLNSQLGDLNLALPQTREGYRLLIESMWLANDTEQARYALLLKLSGAADSYYAALEDGSKSAQASLGNTVESAFAILNKAVTAEKKNLTDLAGQLSGISASLRNALVKAIPGNEVFERAAAQAQLSGSLRSGVMLDQTALDKALGAVAKPSEGLFGTFVDYQRDFIKTANDIAGLSAIADSQLSDTQKQIDALDAILSTAQAQIDAANGTTIAVMSVQDAIYNLNTAITGQQAQKADQAKAISDAAAAEVAANAARVAAAKAVPVVQPVQGPAGDEPQSWIDAWKARISLLRSGAIGMPMWNAWWGAESDTGRGHVTTLFNGGTLKGYASGGLHAGGWRVVGENGPELENTGPSRIYSNPQSKALVDNADLIAVIDALRAELRAANATIAENTRNTAKVLKKWDVDGTPAVAV